MPEEDMTLREWVPSAPTEKPLPSGWQISQQACELIDVALHAQSLPSVNVCNTIFRLTKTQAEDVLDCLEAHGKSGRLSYVEGQGFTVGYVSSS